MGYFYSLFRRNWKTVVASATMGSLAGSSFSVLIIGLINRQLQADLPRDPWVPALYLLFIVAYFALSAWSEYLLLALAHSELHELRLRFSRRILSMPLRSLEQVGAPRLLATLTEDIERVTHAVRQVPTIFIAGSMILGAGAYAAWLSWQLFLGTTVLMALGVGLYQFPLRKLRLLDRYWIRLRDHWDKLIHHFHALTHGTKELLIHRGRREMFFDMCLKETSERLRDDGIRGKAIQGLFFRAGDALWLLILGVLLFVVPELTSLGHDVLTGYLMVGLVLVSPVGTLINWGPNFGEAKVGLDRLKALGVELEGPRTAPTEGTQAFLAPSHSGNSLGGQPVGAALLSLAGVRYRYRRDFDDEEFTLGPLDLEIREGETLFVTGGNGAGKTTLLKLICGLYVPDAGRILWRGEEVTDQNRETYRGFFSVVFSDFYLFDALFGLESYGLEERAHQYLRQLHLHGKVTVKDGRFSTVDLSQGQRKRLALLTAYLEDRPIYIFDEWAADQDRTFKEVFYRQLLPDLAARGKTVIVISHDDAWYGTADRLVKLQNGGLVDGEELTPRE